MHGELGDSNEYTSRETERGMNVEIKARVSDRSALLHHLQPMVESHTVLFQTDTYFRVGHGRLKLRQSQVCGRDGTPGESSYALYFYDRPDDQGPKLSRYERLRLDGEEAALTLKSMLHRSVGTLGTVCKERHLFLVGHTRVHVDTVQGLGDFMELEVHRPRWTGLFPGTRLYPACRWCSKKARVLKKGGTLQRRS